MRTLFSYEDYPKEALKHHWEGTAVADLSISREGVVRACRIVQSSGYEVLDSKTCEIMTRRARFIPARDSDGNPVEDVIQTPPISWRIQH
jgi:protein TonB